MRSRWRTSFSECERALPRSTHLRVLLFLLRPLKPRPPTTASTTVRARRYFLTQDDTGRQAEESCDLGKFGIGAKEAAFFLSDGVDVVTKSSEEPNVRHISLSQNRYEQRKRDGLEVLRDTIGEFEWKFGEQNGFDESNQSDTCKALKSRLANCPKIIDLVHRFASDDHFNIMILPMVQKRHTQQMMGDSREAFAGRLSRLAQVLANTYAFQMFPDKYEMVTAGQYVSNICDHVIADIVCAARGLRFIGSRSTGNAGKGIHIKFECFSDTLPHKQYRCDLNELIERGGCYMGSFLNQTETKARLLCHCSFVCAVFACSV